MELKSGYSDNGPAWTGRVEFSKSGQTIYFDKLTDKVNSVKLKIHTLTEMAPTKVSEPGIGVTIKKAFINRKKKCRSLGIF